MPHFIRAGGAPTWIAIILGIVLLVAAIRFLMAAEPRRLAVLRAMSVAYVLIIVGGVATNFTAVFYGVVEDHERTGKLDPDRLLWGFGEALTTAGLGFTVLGVIWLLIAVGVRRAHDIAA
jgi:hypothetical protein